MAPCCPIAAETPAPAGAVQSRTFCLGISLLDVLVGSAASNREMKVKALLFVSGFLSTAINDQRLIDDRPGTALASTAQGIGTRHDAAHGHTAWISRGDFTSAHSVQLSPRGGRRPLFAPGCQARAYHFSPIPTYSLSLDEASLPSRTPHTNNSDNQPLLTVRIVSLGGNLGSTSAM